MPRLEADSCCSSYDQARRWENLWADFLSWEERSGAFDYQDDGIPLWEYLRVPVFLRLQQACGFLKPPPVPSLWRRMFSLHTVRGLVRASLSANPYLAPSQPVMYCTIARRVYYQGTWRDPYLYPFQNHPDHSYICLERPEGGPHVSSRRKELVYYTDWLSSAAACSRRLNWFLPRQVRSWLREIEVAFFKEFQFHLPISEIGQEYLTARLCLRWLYTQLLKRLRPRVCIIVAINPAERALVEACRYLGIITAELQHGMIGPYDLTYTTPGHVGQRTFPDYMLTFGPYWRKYTSLPVVPGKSIDVGFPFLQEVVERWEPSVRQLRIVVLSQPGCCEALSQWALRLARVAPPCYRVAFRLHPADATDGETCRRLQTQGIEVVPPAQSLYDLLASSIGQVGVFSTALYEGLAFGLRTYIAPLPGYQYMRPLIQRGWARLLEDERQIFDDIQAWPPCDLRELFLFEGTRPFLTWLHRVLT
ncbi:MAG: hypothetical protein NZM42_11670 [Gemmatales bacterium]|nr:hypothetical protein [Gemmatales bacterium]